MTTRQCYVNGPSGWTHERAHYVSARGRPSRCRQHDLLIAARRCFVDGATKSENAAELDLSPFGVARLLELIGGRGLVRIEVAADARVDGTPPRELADAE